MKVTISGGAKADLTIDHPMSSYGIPVLIIRRLAWSYVDGVPVSEERELVYGPQDEYRDIDSIPPILARELTILRAEYAPSSGADIFAEPAAEDRLLAEEFERLVAAFRQ